VPISKATSNRAIPALADFVFAPTMRVFRVTGTPVEFEIGFVRAVLAFEVDVGKTGTT
jgi:hypothetical protein